MHYTESRHYLNLFHILEEQCVLSISKVAPASLSFAASWCPQTSSLTLPPMWWATWFRLDFLQPHSYSPAFFTFHSVHWQSYSKNSFGSCPFVFEYFYWLTVFWMKCKFLSAFPASAFCSLCASWLSSILWLHPYPCGLPLFIIFFISFPVPKEMFSS